MDLKKKITILTGAGISAESGLGTFRDKDGLWTKYPLEEVATPEGFAKNPAKVHDFYNHRRENARQAKPNAAHHALAKLTASNRYDTVVITQNIDALHEAAGAMAIHMHGEIDSALCAACGHRWPAPDVMQPDDPCPSCSARATRPDIVWFGEIPYHMDDIFDHVTGADIFVAIGTSGNVYPAAGFVEAAKDAGAWCIELNLDPSETAGIFDEHHFGQATTVVPGWVATLLK